MAVSRRARLLKAYPGGPHSRILEFESDEELSFSGGQYVIIQTGIPIGDGKTAKRAYSILSSDTNQREFQLAVRRIGPGPGSNYMLDLPVGSEIAFSGPWGKFSPAPGISAQRVVVVATDTGITAALGLIQSRSVMGSPQRVFLFWLMPADEYFIPEAEVRARVEGLCAEFNVFRMPVEQAQRESWWNREQPVIMERFRRLRPEQMFMAGDGYLLACMRDALLHTFDAPPEIRLETFFRHQLVKQ
jgi:ferredoxin-NADP reductase